VTQTRTEESRRLLQERLVLLYRVAFYISAAFVAGMVGLRGLIGGSLMHELTSPARWFHLFATLVTGAVWHALSRGNRSATSLDVLDALGFLGVSLLLTLNAGLFEIRAVAVFNLILTTGLAAMLRAVLVPSTARRTLVLGACSGALALCVFLLSALLPAWPVPRHVHPSWPLSFQLLDLVFWIGACVATATLTSRVIYGLQREVRAMRRLGQYVLGQRLGEGGMGSVYQAKHALLRRDTAIKLLSPERMDSTSIDQFEREVRETSRLRHPNTVAIFDYGRTPDGIFYYAMEYLDGFTLAELVVLEGPLPPSRVVWLLAQVCASLEEAHGAGLVHRDVKPQNVMVTGHTAAFDLVKVLDFGLVKSLASDAASQPEPHGFAGTPLYAAPEAFERPESVDARADLYGVAAVGYYLLTGYPVFDAHTVTELRDAHLHSRPVAPSRRLGRSLPADLEQVILLGLSKAAGDRPESAANFRRDLLACRLPAWTESDARDWWRLRGRRPRPRPAVEVSLARARTISIAPERY
jgi:serine/threonine-protein kinase